MTSLMIVTLIIFVAATTMAGAVILLVREARLRRVPQAHGATALDVDASLELGLPSLKAHSGLDRAFFQLLEQSGTALDHTTALALVIGGAIIGCAAPLFLLENFLLAAVGLAVGAALPLGWFAFGRMRRFGKMRKHLPETLELMADSLQSGRNLEHALELVAKQAPAPLAAEFGFAASQLRLGHAPVAVIDRMQHRVPMVEFHSFATALLVHRQTGGNLGTLAHRLAQSARDRYEFQGHLRAVSAGSRLSALGLLGGSIAAVAILSWIEPEYLEMFLTHRWGMPLLVIAGVLQCLGIVWVWRILKVHF